MKDFGTSAWGYIMLGAVLGAAATVMYYNQGDELCRVGRWVKNRSRQAVDTVLDIAEEEDDDFDLRSEG